MTDHVDDRDKYADVEPGAYVVKDSGQRQEFDTGSRRDTREGKGRFDLIPQYPLVRLARLMERGATKYGERNWEKGQPLMRYLDSAARHLSNLLDGEKTEDHAIQAVFNLFGFVHTLNEIEAGRLPAALDDRPDRMKRLTVGEAVQMGIALPGVDFPLSVGPGEFFEDLLGCDPASCPGEDCGIHSEVMGQL